jgi:hypothetical protein
VLPTVSSGPLLLHEKLELYPQVTAAVLKHLDSELFEKPFFAILKITNIERQVLVGDDVPPAQCIEPRRPLSTIANGFPVPTG